MRCFVAATVCIYVYLPLRLSVVVPRYVPELRRVAPCQDRHAELTTLEYICIYNRIHICIRNMYKYMYKFFYFDFK